jgi:tRNA modification GTPase
MGSADTIFALSSGSPPAAVALVRISGPAADQALEALAGPLPPPRRAVLRELREGGDPLDRALVLRFPAPASATGEDVAELHLHGGRAVVAAVLAALGRRPGLRAAEPGEFTRRAFENGRIDLAEAEGLADLLAAETESQRRSALAAAGGAIGRQVDRWRERILTLAAKLEAVLDFSDEGEVGDVWPAGWHEECALLAAELEDFLARPPAERLRDGIRVVVAGPPNSGKSSLINYLCQREAAITSAVPGTTRDVIEVPVAIGGTPFVLIDTAGMRETDDEIEAIGVDRARSQAAAADILLWLGEPADAPAGTTIRVQSKADVDPPVPHSDIRVSARSGEGIDRLVKRLETEATSLLPGDGEIAANTRQRACVVEAAMALAEGVESSDLLLAAEAVRSARTALDRLTGGAGLEDMLDAVFGRFCIGK